MSELLFLRSSEACSALSALFLILALALFSAVKGIDSDKKSTDSNFVCDYTDNDWVYIGTNHDVKGYTLSLNGIQHTAVKGVGSIPLHITNVFSVFLNTSLSVHWIDMLHIMEDYQLDAKDEAKGMKYPMSSLVYQRYDLPFPLTDRDFVLRRDISFDSKDKQITVIFTSIDDERFPVRKDLIRGQTYFAKWIFRKQESQEFSTFVSIETVSDLKGNLPAFFVDYLQRSWPSKTVHALRQLTEKQSRSDTVGAAVPERKLPPSFQQVLSSW